MWEKSSKIVAKFQNDWNFDDDEKLLHSKNTISEET